MRMQAHVHAPGPGPLHSVAGMGLLLLLLLSGAGAEAGGRRPAPLIVAHRGHPGAFPEHSEPGFLSALSHGADFLECDVHLTR